MGGNFCFFCPKTIKDTYCTLKNTSPFVSPHTSHYSGNAPHSWTCCRATPASMHIAYEHGSRWCAWIRCIGCGVWCASIFALIHRVRCHQSRCGSRRWCASFSGDPNWHRPLTNLMVGGILGLPPRFFFLPLLLAMLARQCPPMFAIGRRRSVVSTPT